VGKGYLNSPLRRRATDVIAEVAGRQPTKGFRQDPSPQPRTFLDRAVRGPDSLDLAHRKWAVATFFSDKERFIT
jgi:hypothetical protein